MKRWEVSKFFLLLFSSFWIVKSYFEMGGVTNLFPKQINLEKKTKEMDAKGNEFVIDH